MECRESRRFRSSTSSRSVVAHSDAALLLLSSIERTRVGDERSVQGRRRNETRIIHGAKKPLRRNRLFVQRGYNIGARSVVERTYQRTNGKERERESDTFFFLSLPSFIDRWILSSCNAPAACETRTRRVPRGDDLTMARRLRSFLPPPVFSP